MVSTTSIQDSSKKLGAREGSAKPLKRGKATKWSAAIAQWFRTKATCLRVLQMQEMEKLKIGLLKKKTMSQTWAQRHQEQRIFQASLPIVITCLLFKRSLSSRRESQEGTLAITHLLLQPRASSIP